MLSLDSIHKYRHIEKSRKRALADYERQSQKRYGLFTLYNWWSSGTYLWFIQRYKDIVKGHGSNINFCSVFGDRNVLDLLSGIKIFFSGENVHNAPYDVYSDYLLKDQSTDLSLGFEYFEDKRYLRFPLWILYMFEPCSTRTDIIKRCEELRNPVISDKSMFCSMIASHDPNGLRRIIVNDINSIASVSCAGKFLHNDDSLKTLYADSKKEYLKRFSFNICPENSNSYGYVTEKLFEAFDSGCVPIYWGSFNNPEPSIINKDAILFWDKDNNNDALLQKIEQLYASPKELNDFLHIPRLVEGAEDIICEMFDKLDSAIIPLINN